MQQPEVLVVGAGFAGFECARRLARRAINVTVVDPEDYFFYTFFYTPLPGGGFPPLLAEDLLPDDVGVAAVLGQLAKDMQVDPPQR